MQASPVLSTDWRDFTLAGTANDADFVPIRGLLESCFTLAACPLLGRRLVLLFVKPGSDHFRSDTAPAVYPCKGDGRKVFAGHCICCTKLRAHFLAAQAGAE